MDPLFSRMTQRYTPPMNATIMNGYGSYCMEEFEAYVDSQIRSVATSFPKQVKYINLVRPPTPAAEYIEATKARGAVRTFNLAESSIYMVRLNFEFTNAQGQVTPITRHMYFPFVGDAAILKISGKEYHLVPVISDKVFTPSGERLFVRLTRSRDNIYRAYHTIVINGARETQYVAWSQIHRKDQASTVERTTKAVTTLAHYLFARYGFTETFQRYTGVVPIVGDANITPELYPPDEWNICETSFFLNSGPKDYLQRNYHASKVKLAVRKHDWTPAMEGLVYGFFYVLDHFPERILAHPSYYDAPATWLILLGHIHRSGHYGENKLYNEMLDHLESIAGNLDTEVKRKLEQRGIFLNDFFDLLGYVVAHMNELMTPKEDPRNLVGKNLEILYHVAYPIIGCVVRLNYALSKMFRDRVPSPADLGKAFSTNLRLGAVFDLRLPDTPVTELVAYNGDLKYSKITAILQDQESSASNNSQQNKVVVGVRDRLELSAVMLGSILNFPKSAPYPNRRINPWATIDPKTGTILENPKFTELLARTKPFLDIP